MFKKLLKVITVMSLTAVVLVGCGNEKDETTIVMGTNADFAPFEYREGKNVVGFDVDISEKIAEKVSKELRIEDMEFEGLIAALNSGKVDFIAAGFTRDETREKEVDFSDAYFVSNQLITVRADDDRIKGSDDLKGKKIGVQIGTTGEQVSREIEGTEVISFDKGAMALMDLTNGKIDAVVLDEEPTKNYTKGNEALKVLEEELTEEEYCIAVRKGDKELLDKINEVLKEIVESGEYQKLIEKYF